MPNETTSDLLVRGGTLVDGTGAPARQADLRVRDGIIAEVGTNLKPEGEREIDASGAYVTPGFIEQHTHYDFQLWWDPYCDPMLGFGMTTVVMGHCGHSAAPIREANRAEFVDFYSFVEDLPNEALATGVPWTWETWPEYARAARAHPLAINAAPLVGHTPIRVYVMGDEAWEREATDAEIAAMATLLSESLSAGAFGMSNGTIDVDRDGRPVPCRLAGDEERRELYRVLGQEERILMHAVRLNDPAQFGPDIEKLADDIRETGTRATWAALLATPGEEDLRQEIIDQHHRLREEGIDIWGQAYGRPQHGAINFERSFLFQGIPAWNEMVNSPADVKHAMLRDPEWRARARSDWDGAEINFFPHRHLDTINVGACKPEFERFRGMSVDQMIRARGAEHPSDGVADWLVDNGTEGTAFLPPFGQGPNSDQAAVLELLREPGMLAGASDAGAHIQVMCSAGESTYVLTKHVRDDGRLSIEEAVHLYTQKQADFWGIRDRGVIQPGYAADLAVFDLDTLYHPDEDVVVRDLPCDTWRYTKPAKEVGFKATIVNGTPVWLEGELTGERPGGFLDPKAVAVPGGHAPS